MEKRKNLRDLNLLDRFLFAEAMEDPVIVKSVLEIVLGKEITEEVSSRCQSNRIKDMQRRIEAIKSSEEIGVRYMQAWEEKILVQRKAREEGIEQGRAEGIEQGRVVTLVETYKEFGMSKEDIITKLMDKCQISSEDARKYVEQYWNQV